MANIHQANQFANSFVRGFGFVDDINSRKRQEAKLDQRLEEERKDREIQRQIQTHELAARGQDRANSLVDRQRGLKDQQRQREANALLADPNTDPAQLQEYADLPGVSAILRQQGIDTRDQADLATLTQSGLNQQATGNVPPPTESPSNEGLSSQVKAAQIPLGIGQPTPQLTKRELNQVADTQGSAAAMEIRDKVAAARNPEADPDQVIFASAGPRSDRVVSAADVKRDKDRKRERGQVRAINDQWHSFLDIEDRVGDQLRTLDPNVLTAKYFQDRSNITDPLARQNVDTRMKEPITASINTQQEILTSAAPNSVEATNARRKLSQAYGLANEIGISYSPLLAAGVDDRGLPIGGNDVLTDSVLTQTQQAAGTPLPPNPQMTRADLTMLNRGTTGSRVNARFGTAAFRQYKNGRINFEQYTSLMQTGRLPSAAGSITQTDPGKDTWMTHVDPVTKQVTRQLIVPARDIKKDQNGRNLIDDEGLAHINRISAAYNTKDDEQRGTRLGNSFISALAQNENRARQMGYDLSNVNDVGVLFERWTQLHVVRDQYNDEWFNNGQFNPDFTEDYGELDEALFNRAVDEEIDRDSIADFGGDPIPLTGAKQRDPTIYQSIRQGAPEFAQSSDEEIEAALQAQGL